MRKVKRACHDTIPTFLEPMTPFDVYFVKSKMVSREALHYININFQSWGVVRLSVVIVKNKWWCVMICSLWSNILWSFSFHVKNPRHWCPLLSTVGLSYLYSDMWASPIHWMKSHGGLSAKKCDCGDWTCGLAICVGWEMNQSLIYEVRQHSLLSVLAQFSSLQSHPAQQVALWTW